MIQAPMTHKDIKSLITENLDIWTSAIKAKSRTGRGANKTYELYGIKKLRELILDLAVRGLLVTQDSNDEPASELVKKIAAEKEQLIKEGKIKKQKALPPIKEDQKPFELPMSWELIRLGNIGDWGSGSTPKRGNPEYYGGDIPWFKSGELISDYISETEEKVTYKALSECSLRLNKPGDVLIAMYGATIGKTSILEVEGTTNQAVCACTVFKGTMNNYLLLVLKAFRKRFINMGAGGAQPNISKIKIINTVIALPPLKEQKHIVAKVDELMALCDQLEQQTDTSIKAHKLLVENLLNALTQAKDHKTFQQAWHRIANHFDTLFTTEHSIDQLKQTILQLAVMGKLVPQNPNDEPASELLKKIAAEKEKLIKEGKIKKQKPLPEISEEEKPFELPVGWEWVRVGQFSILKGGYAFKSKEFVDESEYQVIRIGNIRPDFLRINKNAVYISSDYAENTKEYEILENDILLTMTGTKGKRDYLYSLIIDNTDLENRKLYVNQRLCIVRTLIINEYYINMVMKDNRMLDSIYAKSTGTANQANIGMDAISNWIIPLPTLDEQFRIIIKTEELMRICDLIKCKIITSKKSQIKIAETLSLVNHE
ncbi:MAG: restriction endonuclease subunit S [Marinicella pacifica]